MRCRSLIWVEVGECRQKESSAACVTVEYQTFTRGFNSSQRSYRHLRAGLSYNHQPNIIWEENPTHILPLIRCYASQTHHSRWECAMQQFGVSRFYAVKISHDSYYFCSSHVALYLVTFWRRSPFIQCSGGDIWYFLRCCFDSHGNRSAIVFSAVGAGQGTWCLMTRHHWLPALQALNNCAVLENGRKSLDNIMKSASSSRCSYKKYPNAAGLTFCAEHRASLFLFKRFPATLWQQTPWWTLWWPTPWFCPPGTSWTDPSSCATCSTPPPTRSTGSRSRRACWSQVTRLKPCVRGRERLPRICYWEGTAEVQISRLLLTVCCFFFSPWTEGEDPHLDERETDWTTWLRTTC